jgi:hypothetical protein
MPVVSTTLQILRSSGLLFNRRARSTHLTDKSDSECVGITERDRRNAWECIGHLGVGETARPQFRLEFWRENFVTRHIDIKYDISVLF